MRRSKKIKRRDFILRIGFLTVIISLGFVLFNKLNVLSRLASNGKRSRPPSRTLKQTIKFTEANYGAELNKLAISFNLPAEYLKALVVLEVGGRKPAPVRYEKKVFNRLKKLRKGELKRYELLKKETIADASDDALKNLSTSWGAFQIMGYKCVQLGVKVSDIRGDKSLYWGVKWINDEYGNFLRKKKFKDAFHLHNTGRKFPKNGIPRTYHPDYVDNGLKYLEMFKQYS